MLRLDVNPKGGLKALLEIKKIFNLDMSMQELKKIPGELPCSIFETTYGWGLEYTHKINKNERLVSIWKKSDENHQMPDEFS